MKQIVTGELLKNKIEEAIDLLCGTVKQTLGPMGNNVIVDHSSFSPFITNDGVTIAKNIESDDPIIGAIIEIAKEASINTDDNVGDGTTTTLVLLESLIKLSHEQIAQGANAIAIKRNLEIELNLIIQELDKMKYTADKDLLKNIASVSAGDQDIGYLVSEVVENVLDRSAITIKEKNEKVLEVKYVMGYHCSVTHASEYYFQDANKKFFNESYILIVNDMINNIDGLEDILNAAIKDDKALVIVAKGFNEYLGNDIISLNLEGKINCFMVKIAEYGLRERIIEKDLEFISGAQIVENINNVNNNNLGIVKNLYIDKDSLKINFDSTNKIDEYVLKINEEIEDINDEFEKEFYLKRRSMFSNGMAEIIIGAPTKAECHERRMRLEDAVCSTIAARSGVLPGGGIALLNVSAKLKRDDKVSKIWFETLKKPFEQILTNAAENVETIKEKLEQENYNLVYNVCTNNYENIKKTNIVDAYLVVKNSLINACSIACMLLSTSSLVINEYKNNLNKINDYTEL